MKKQTVWLLTMLSLVVVLSVYYVTTPDNPKSDMVNSPVNQAGKEEAKENGNEVVQSGGDDLFAQLRLEMEDARDEMKEQLQEVMVSPDTTAEQKNKAMDQLQVINDLSTKESLIETLIKSQGYKDALVRAEEETIRITVRAEEHSAKDANKIMQLVRSEVGQKHVAVKFEPVE